MKLKEDFKIGGRTGK